MTTDWQPVPLELGPCDLEAWMAAHDNWILSLDDDLSPEDLRALFARHAASPCQKTGVLSEVAQHPNTPSDVLAALVASRYSHSHLALALNSNLTDEQLRRLARSRRLDVLEHVTFNPKTPADELRRLVGHRSDWIRESADTALRRRGLHDSAEDRPR